MVKEHQLWPGMEIILYDGTKCSVCCAFEDNVETMIEGQNRTRTVEYHEIKEVLPERRTEVCWVGYNPQGGKE